MHLASISLVAGTPPPPASQACITWRLHAQAAPAAPGQPKPAKKLLLNEESSSDDDVPLAARQGGRTPQGKPAPVYKAPVYKGCVPPPRGAPGDAVQGAGGCRPAAPLLGQGAT